MPLREMSALRGQSGPGAGLGWMSAPDRSRHRISQTTDHQTAI